MNTTDSCGREKARWEGGKMGTRVEFDAASGMVAARRLNSAVYPESRKKEEALG